MRTDENHSPASVSSISGYEFVPLYGYKICFIGIEKWVEDNDAEETKIVELYVTAVQKIDHCLMHVKNKNKDHLIITFVF